MTLSRSSAADSASGSNRFNRYVYSSSSAQCSSLHRPVSTWLQIFVRNMSDGKTIVIHADKHDKVELLLHRIYRKTKIPVTALRVVYKGKQLRNEHSLGYYSIEQDSTVQVVGRMPSSVCSDLPAAYQVINDIIYTISRVNKGENLRYDVNENIDIFFKMLPEDKDDSLAKYFNILLDSSVPSILVMLYASSLERYKSYAKSSIKLFLSKCIALPKNQLSFILPLVLEFCKLLRKFCPDQKLYDTFRDAFGVMLVDFSNLDASKCGVVTLGMQIFQFFTELTGLLMNDLVKNSWPSFVDCYTLCAFWQQLKNAIDSKGAYKIPSVFLSQKNVLNVELGHLHQLLVTLLTTMDLCMCKIESSFFNKEEFFESMFPSLSQYLAILKIINSISNLYQDYKERVDDMLHKHKVIFCILILLFAKRGNDHDYQWIFEHKNVINSKTRRHLVMLLFPDVNEDFNEMYEMLIDRSDLLAESFEYIAKVSPEALHGGLFMEFINEEATGPGVLREWFYLVCQEIFSQKNTLFLRSADDCRRFSPNPASKVDPLHLDFFRFTGRVIALALMHEVQVGVLFDRVFYSLLAGKKICLEDIKDTDRMMYNSCKQILEMDPVDFDSASGLGLTFVLETEEMGKRDAIELCKGGKFIGVNSKNRNRYVNLLILRRFALPIIEQVKQFSRGFADMLSDPKPPISFFKKLCLEDFDGMLRGEENSISIDDWEAHTEYTGFKKSEHQICWFWKILKNMTEEEQRNILFFWTSIKFLPVEGFRGLSSKLYIYKLEEANDRLPSSQTCFNRLYMPKYSTITLMERQLRFITQDHVSSGFGKW